MFCFLLLTALAAAPPTPAPHKPKLVIAVDQFRYDYLTRYRNGYTGGLNRVLTKGAPLFQRDAPWFRLCEEIIWPDVARTLPSSGRYCSRFTAVLLLVSELRVAFSVFASDSRGRLRMMGSTIQPRPPGTLRVRETASHST